ncbi:NAD(P)/FAD-dependent oxidoreductase [Bacteroidota bacterium]
MKKPKVIIIGGGFGGLNAAKALRHADVNILLVDKTNYHLFQPLLYQVATAALSPGDIATPIRAVLRKQKNVTVIMGEVISIDKKNQKIKLVIGEEINFDYLIIATGSRHSYFGNDNWGKAAPGLKTVSDALKIRERVLLSFERAERFYNKIDVDQYLKFVIVGGGPTGVEIAGAIAEISKKTMLRDFRRIDPAKTEIILVEAGNKILPAFDSGLSETAERELKALGVTVKVNNRVTEISEEGVQLNDEFVKTRNVIWAAGNEASYILKSLNTELDGNGRVIVNDDCSIKDHENIFVIGDAAHNLDKNKDPLPGIAPVAIQQGKYVAKIIADNKKKGDRISFRYFDKGTMATIGRAKAIGQIGRLKFSGFPAWLVWSFVHIMYLIDFRNRYMVMTEWMWYYFSNKKQIRLITNKTDL